MLRCLFFACKAWGLGSCPGVLLMLHPGLLLLPARLCPHTSPWGPAGHLSPGHITHFPDSQRNSSGWIWGRCHPTSPVLLAYPLPGCARLCCGCWQAREWKNKWWRRSLEVRAQSCKHAVPLPSPVLEGCPFVTAPALAPELGMTQAANKALEAKRKTPPKMVFIRGL